MRRLTLMPHRWLGPCPAALGLEPGIGDPGSGGQLPGADDSNRPKARPPECWTPTLGPRRARGHGFTLIELIIVVAIIGILATIAVPAMRQYPQRAREAALKEDLFTMRSCIDQFHADRGRYPSSLDELVSMGYMRGLPRDPITRSQDTWIVDYAEMSDEQDERDRAAGQGIIDVHSGSEEIALDGTRYSDW